MMGDAVQAADVQRRKVQPLVLSATGSVLLFFPLGDQAAALGAGAVLGVVVVDALDA